MTIEKLPKPVYYIESPNDDTVLVGIDVTIEHRKDVTIIGWYDTLRTRRMTADAVKQEGDYFAFKRSDQEGGGYYSFAPMNLKIYKDKVEQRLLSKRDFANDEELINDFLATLENNI